MKVFSLQSVTVVSHHFSSRKISLPDLIPTVHASYPGWQLTVLTAAHTFAVILWLILQPIYIILWLCYSQCTHTFLTVLLRI